MKMPKVNSLWGLAGIGAVSLAASAVIGIFPAHAVSGPIQITPGNCSAEVSIATGVGPAMELANTTDGEFFLLGATKVTIPDAGIKHSYVLPAGSYAVQILDENGKVLNPQPVEASVRSFTVKCSTETATASSSASDTTKPSGEPTDTKKPTATTSVVVTVAVPATAAPVATKPATTKAAVKKPVVTPSGMGTGGIVLPNNG